MKEMTSISSEITKLLNAKMNRSWETLIAINSRKLKMPWKSEAE